MQIINPSPSAVYTGIVNAFSTIARVEGAHSLWRGVSSVVLGAGTKLQIMVNGRPLTAYQDLLTRSTLPPTKLSSKLLGATISASTTLLLRVRAGSHFLAKATLLM